MGPRFERLPFTRNMAFMSSSLDHKCQRCGSNYQGQICPFCTITGLDVNALLASESLTMHQEEPKAAPVSLVDVVTGRVYIVTTPVCRIGRDLSNDIILSGDKSLSRFHFQITFLDGQYYAEDAGSRNGTFLNGSPVQAPRQVLNGDVLSAGMSRYRFVVEGSESSSAETSPTNEKRSELPGSHFDAAPDTETFAPPGSAAEALVASAVAAESNNHKDSEKAEDKNKDDGKVFELDDNTLLQLDDQAFEEVLESSKHHTEAVTKPNLSSGPPADMSVNVAQAKAPDGSSTMDASDIAAQALAAAIDPSTSTTLPDIPTPVSAIPALTIKSVTQGAPEDGTGQAAATPPAQAEPAPAPAGPTTDWPEWTNKVQLAEIAEKQNELDSIAKQMEEMEARLRKLKSQVAGADQLKNRLLAGKERELAEACCQVFDSLGWVSELDSPAAGEVLLRSPDGTPVAIAHFVSTDLQPKPGDLSNLVGAISNYWSNHGTEPKGILIVAIQSNEEPQARAEINKESLDYASRKGLCLITPLQLLSIYRKVDLQGGDSSEVTSAILSENGQLKGYTLE